MLVLFLNIRLLSALGHEGKSEKWERAINFSARLLDLPLIYLVTDSSENLNLCYSYKKESHPITDLPTSLKSLRINPTLEFHVLKTVFIKLLKNQQLRSVISVTLQVHLYVKCAP